MPKTIRAFPILLLFLSLAGTSVLTAQTPDAEATVVDGPGDAAVETSPDTSYEASVNPADPLGPVEPLDANARYSIRNELSTLLRHYSSELGMVLALDPRLLDDRSYLAPYPELRRFLAEHPEIRTNPRFYLGEFTIDEDSHLVDDLFEGLEIFSVIGLFALSMAWLVRTLVEQKRWNRLSRTQTEVHTRLLERFGSSEELLEYMRTPAGSKFLESAPIPVHDGADTTGAPMSRILWSIQIGVVVAAAALGLLFVSWRLGGDSGEGLFALGVVAFCVGSGFVASALVSWKLSESLGLWNREKPSGSEPSASLSQGLDA